MSLWKRGDTYWYDFVFRGERIRESTHQGDRKAAGTMEAARKTQLAQEYQEREIKADKLGCGPENLVTCLYCGSFFNRDVAVITSHGQFCGKTHRDQWEKDHVSVPTLREFQIDFMKSVETRSADKPSTVEFYRLKFDRLLDFTPLADSRLDRIDDGMIESYVQHRSKAVEPSTVNRELATLRKALRLAMKWNVIDRVPSFDLFSEDGRERTFVLSQPQEKIYLEFAPQPLRDIGLLMLDTGLRVGEACAADWADVHLEPAPGARYGYVHVPKGKTRHAKRNVPLTGRVREMLAARRSGGKSRWVFPDGNASGPITRFTLRTQHQVLRKKLKFPADFVIHSLRHTALTRLGESGAGAFEIMRAAGHCSVTVSQKYVHPSPESIERAFERLEVMNAQARAALPGISHDRPTLPGNVIGEPGRDSDVTVFTTGEDSQIDPSKEVA